MFMRGLRLAAAVLALGVLAQAGPPRERLAEVDPFIGTGGHGHTFPGATLPFGMVQVSPDTRLTGWDGCSVYHASDHYIFGFSHTHLSGTGCPDYGDVLLLPATGPVKWRCGHVSRADQGYFEEGPPDLDPAGYGTAFRKESEKASPGFYAVDLDTYGTRAELTATPRTALHRYTFPTGESHVLLDLEPRDEVLESELRVLGTDAVEGLRRSKGWAKDQRVYFAARFSRPFDRAEISVDGAPAAALSEARGKKVKAALFFKTRAGETVLVKVGLSSVSAEGAWKNLEAEQPGWDFEGVRERAARAWEAQLAKVTVSGGTPAQRRTFATALYHAFLTPNLYSDADGRYRGRDLEIHQAKGFDYYTVFSLWDTFRAEHPFFTLVERKRTADFVRTMLREYREGGRLPIWELSSNETFCMIAYHAVPVIADALLKGLGGASPQEALEAMAHSADEDRRGLVPYARLGYIPAEAEPESVSQTLEYAYDDWCIAQVARLAGRPDETARFLKRAQAYKHLYDPGTGFMRARMEGLWFSPFDPFRVDFNYTEGNAWQYAFFVPQDVEGLVRLHGGRNAFAAKLDALFAADPKITGSQLEDVSGMVGQYAHGNEPSHHMAYLYAWAGQPWKTQALVRRLMDTFYADRPDGLIGNEDCGQMSAWYLFSALGFYPVNPASGCYVLGTPLFPEAALNFEDGRRFVVKAPGASAARCYIQWAKLNGKPLHRCFLTHDEIVAGGELVLGMGDAPNRSWATGPGAAPPSAIADPAVVPVPFVASGTSPFRGSTEVALGDVDPRAEVRYTLDGGEPGPASAPYERPIALGQSATLRAVALVAGLPPSPFLEARFSKIPDGRTVTLSARYSPQYAAGGDDALIDGLRGGPNYRLGRWQGYQGEDLEAIVDLGRMEEVGRVAAGFIQESRAWVMMPRQVSFAISVDGKAWTPVGTVANTVPDTEKAVVTKDFDASFPVSRARYVKVVVTKYGNLPAWHNGAGSPAFFFCDEITVEAAGGRDLEARP